MDRTALLDELAAVFEPRDGPSDAPLRLTPGGIHLATPLPVLADALPALLAESPLRASRRLVVLDAGAGDGRMLGALGLSADPAWALRLVGVECDPELHARARERLDALVSRESWPGRPGPELLLADWSAPETLAALGLALGQVDLVLNYPDGNETRLAEWIAAKGGPRTRAGLLHPYRLDRLPPLAREWSREVPSGCAGIAWHATLWRIRETQR